MQTLIQDIALILVPMLITLCRWQFPISTGLVWAPAKAGNTGIHSQGNAQIIQQSALMAILLILLSICAWQVKIHIFRLYQWKSC